MKTLLLACTVAILALPVAPVLAQGHATVVAPTTAQTIDRKSGRCPGGEIRFFVPGCSGV